MERKNLNITLSSEGKIRERSPIDLDEAREPIIESGRALSAVVGPCSNSGNGCTGSCNRCSK